MTASPVSIGEWRITSKAHDESSSAAVSTLILGQAREPTLHEIHSVRFTLSEEGTGDLASGFIADGPVPSGFGNDDRPMMAARDEASTAGVSTYWHWSRSNQLVIPQPTVYLPPGFYWQGEMWGWMQNGAGATLTGLWLVVHRPVSFRTEQWARLTGTVLPKTYVKDVTVT